MQTSKQIMEETEGVITKLSMDRCVVSIDINGTSVSLPFGKSLLYTWGQQCDGDMTNILEEKMEVDVCYKYFQAQNKPSVVAVWIGEKPDLSNNNVQPLDEVYNQMGIVEKMLDDGSFIVRADGVGCAVEVSQDVLYRDGCLLDITASPVSIGESVMFDAVSRGGDPPGPAYAATCAWIGQEPPRLVNRFGFQNNPAAQDLDVLTRDRVYGIVVVIPNSTVAFVKEEESGEKVLLFRNSFSQSSERLDEVVQVGDTLCMRLSFYHIFPGSRQWFALAACKDGEDISMVNRSVSLFQSVESFSSSAQASDGSSAVLFEDDVTGNSSESDDFDMNKIRQVFGGEEFTKAMEEKSIDLNFSSSEVENDLEVFDESSSALYSDPPLTGLMHVRPKVTPEITYKEFTIRVSKNNFYINGRRSSAEEFRSLRGTTNTVKFEAYADCRHTSKTKLVYKYVASRVWVGEKPSLSCVASTLCKGKYLLPADGFIEGKVTEYYLPDVAFLAIGKTSRRLIVCLHVIEFRSESCKKNISDFVKVKEYVKFKVKENKDFPFGMCAYDIKKSSKKAWKDFLPTLKPDPQPLKEIIKSNLVSSDFLSTGITNAAVSSAPSLSTSKSGEIDVGDSEDISWHSIWGSGEFFKTGKIEVIDDSYVVEFVSTEMPGTRKRLDLITAIQTKQFFCNGKNGSISPAVEKEHTKRATESKEANSESDNKLKGSEISFHIGKRSAKGNDFEVIKFAWIGEYPDLPMLLNQKTNGFHNLICPKWYYEGVVEDFPLPTHAICKVGSLYVHLPLTVIERNDVMIGVVESHLKKGDTVLLRIRMQYFPPAKHGCLTSYLCSSIKKVFEDTDVLRSVRGTVVALPSPCGKIKMIDGSIEVMFDRSAVSAVNGILRSTKIIYAWMHMVDKNLNVGTEVYFSAAKDCKFNSYRAFDVKIK